MVRRLLLVAGVSATLLLGACTDSSAAVRAVEALGLTTVETHGYTFFGCGEDDTFHTKFTAKNARGETVSGVVCGSRTKQSTVRFD